MRSALSMICLALVLAGCSRRATLTEYGTVESAQSASILGEWVLANPQETQFIGASRVLLTLEPGEFRLVAEYPGQAPIVVDGEALFYPNGGQLTLTPRSNTRPTTGDKPPLLPVGEDLIVLATAADNTMVFAEPGDTVHMPTSVWHRASAAQRAADATLPANDTLPR